MTLASKSRNSGRVCQVAASQPASSTHPQAADQNPWPSVLILIVGTGMTAAVFLVCAFMFLVMANLTRGIGP
jgi:hypothetical protein